MFGRKSEDLDEYNERASAAYDDEYIAPVEEYRSGTVSYDGTEDKKPVVSDEFLKDEFRKHLERGEQILYVYGDGKGRSVNPMGLFQSEESGKKVGIAAGIIVFVFVLLAALMIFGVISFIAVVFIMPFIAIIGAVAVAVVMEKKYVGTDYVITNRRILSLSSGRLKRIEYSNVTKVSCTEKSGNTGSVIVTATEHFPELRNEVLELRKVSDPQGVKQLIERAVDTYQSGQC
jgi:hypothetical protein